MNQTRLCRSGILAVTLIGGGLFSTITALAQHQDIDIELSGGQVATAGGVYTTGPYADRVFEGDMAPGTPNNETIEPGFDAIAGTFPQGNQIRFDFVQQLLYWNGTVLAAPASNLTVSLGGNSTTISGTNTSGLPGFIVGTAGATGGFHQDLTWSVPNTAADGLYGVVLTLGPAAGTTGFTASEPFLIGFVNGDPTGLDVSGGLAAMANVALVPEPGGLVLAAAGIAAAAVAVRRRGRPEHRG